LRFSFSSYGLFGLLCRQCLPLATVFLLLSNQPSGAETLDGPWTMTADRVVAYNSPQAVTAEGRVVLQNQADPKATPLVVRADMIKYQSDITLLIASGNVSLQEKSGWISAESAVINLQSQTGTLRSTSIFMADQELSFIGDTVEKTGEARYRFTDATVTSCRQERDKSPAWSILCSKADVTIDGMAYLKNATLRIRKIPVFYMPYLVLPAKTTRQTGFLFPEISSSSRDGTGLITPFFINLSPSSDITLYPGYLAERGMFGGLEIRHVVSGQSQATLAANYLHDRTEDTGITPVTEYDYRQDGFLRTEHDRYWIRGKGDHYFAENRVVRLDLDMVSDHDFIHEYRDGMTGFSKSNLEFARTFNRGLQEASLEFRESILQLTSGGNLSTAGLELRYIDNPLTDLTGSEPVHTLPRIMYRSRLPLTWIPASLDWNSEYLYYFREEGVGYHRLDLFPRLVLPVLPGRFAEGIITGGLHETVYEIETHGSPIDGGWNSSDSKNRNTWDFSANLAKVLARDFALPRGESSRLTHIFRPNLKYRYLYAEKQEALPVIDNDDHLTPQNLVTLQLNNYFRHNKINQSGPLSREIGYLKFSQSYDLREERRELSGVADKRRPFSDLTMDLEITPSPELSLRYQTALNVYGNGVPSYELRGRYSNKHDDSLLIDYNYQRGVKTDLTITAKARLHQKFTTRYSTTRSLLDDHKTTESLGLTYLAQCWSADLAVSEDSEDRRVMLTFSLTGIGKALEINQSGL